MFRSKNLDSNISPRYSPWNLSTNKITDIKILVRIRNAIGKKTVYTYKSPHDPDAIFSPIFNDALSISASPKVGPLQIEI